MVKLPDFKSTAASRQNSWLTCLLALIAIFVLVHLVNDYRSGLEFGWDVRVNCAAVEAYAKGLDPYYVKNLTGTNLSFPYLPVTLDVFRPLCVDGFLVRHFREIYLAVAAASALLLSSFSFTQWGIRETLLKFLYVFAGFVGFEWTFITGNLVILSGLLTAVALALFYHGFSLREQPDGKSIVYYMAGAAVFGLLTSIKVVLFPLLLSFYFFPLSRRHRIFLIIVGAVCFLAPGLTSFVFYNDLFFSWVKAVSGQIPGQHSPATEGCNPSLLCLGQSIAENLGFIEHRLIGFVFYGLAAVLLVLGPLAGLLIRLVKRQYAADNMPFLEKLDRLLIDNPQFAMRLATLSMFALYLCSPRLKEYAYFELAIYAATLVVDLTAIGIATVFTVSIVAPMLAMGSANAFVNTFGQTIAALCCFQIFLADIYPSFDRLKMSSLRAT